MRHPEWPAEDVALEICWNGDPDDCQVVAREFLPNLCCANCKFRPDCDLEAEDMDNVCDRYEWDEDTDNLLDEPRKPKREDYRTDKAYRQAMNAYNQWWLNVRRDDDW